MITLTTAARSRGTDFDDINVGILAKPNWDWVTKQKAGRIARNKQFGIIYEIYCMKDLDLSRLGSLSFFPKSEDPGHRRFILAHEIAMEDFALEAIEKRQAMQKLVL